MFCLNKKNKEICRKWNSLGKHHIIPVVRGGKNNKDNIKNIDGKFHWCYHAIFGVLTPDESQIMMQLIFYGKKCKWKAGEIKKLQRLIQFGKISEAIKFAEYKRDVKNLIKK